MSKTDDFKSTIANINEFVEKADQMKKVNKLDLSSDQDLTFAIMHLISIEEHFIFTGSKTEKTKYYDLVDEVREMRKELMQKVVVNPEGEIWCISKHLLGGSMRLMEVGTKQLNLGNKDEAYNLFKKAYDMYALFWGLNMNLIDTGKIRKIADTSLNKSEQKAKTVAAKAESSLVPPKSKKKSGLMGSLEGLVKKVIDCCIE